MYVFTKLLQITFLLFISLTLHIIPWVPSLAVENVVNFSIIGLFVVAGYLVYLVVKRLNDTQKKRNIYKSTAYTLLLFSYVGFFAILQIGVSLGKSKYLKTYAFEEFTFYTYSTADGSTEISIKDSSLPIRSVPILSVPYTAIVLKREKNHLYAVGENTHLSVYDFTNNLATKHLKNKETHE